MLDGPALLIVVLLGLGIYGGEQVVKGVKKIDHAVAHAVKKAGSKVVHVVTFGKK